MPTVAPGSKVLVTGANGYIALWVVKKLLEAGYSVRGTVRSADKGAHAKNLFKAYGDKFELAIVPDITKEGAFDEAVKGVDAIEHTSSPFNSSTEDPQGYIKPAVSGTVGILQSALKYGPDVKRIVITSSFVAVLDFTAPTNTEEHWNNAAIEDVEKNGSKASSFNKYSASKTLAEKAAWDFHSKHKDQVKWDLTFICPPYIFGPLLRDVKSPGALNESMDVWWKNLVDNKDKTQAELNSVNWWVDVRDVATAHVLALEKEEAGGERVIILEGEMVWQKWLNYIHTLDPSPLPNHQISKGFPGVEVTFPISVDNSKAARIYGIKYISKEETIKDVLKDFAERGW